MTGFIKRGGGLSSLSYYKWRITIVRSFNMWPLMFPLFDSKIKFWDAIASLAPTPASLSVIHTNTNKDFHSLTLSALLIRFTAIKLKRLASIIVWHGLINVFWFLNWKSFDQNLWIACKNIITRTRRTCRSQQIAACTYEIQTLGKKKQFRTMIGPPEKGFYRKCFMSSTLFLCEAKNS